jgi:hypothetical protein
VSSLIFYVLLVIVPPPISETYRGFTNLVRRKYLDWLFTSTTDDFDRTLSRMPRYGNHAIAWGYAKDARTVRCGLGIMMDLYALRKNQGNPLGPSDKLIPRIVSMWNVGKGPIPSVVSPILRSNQRDVLDLDTNVDDDDVQCLALERDFSKLGFRSFGTMCYTEKADGI